MQLYFIDKDYLNYIYSYIDKEVLLDHLSEPTLLEYAEGGKVSKEFAAAGYYAQLPENMQKIKDELLGKLKR
mgnify:CR=1 FL=1